ncbi:Radical SAM superfamily protein [Neptunomonas qingdaonensis]|uniref:Radical SAM superfamily protein n=2 Tax=Neptunomonas qingdaonensis TaxID=1045558 RepID=A0A1I2PCZ6_9GAMM|nr:radical SAM protein [Neptunomonas qingdaonensis]SFG13393.1 Radical SAM superfamily protein [Neptunomonas qingdaonensis]
MWMMPPVNYIEPLFRPPSEAHSLILQVTNGCSWNKCVYCEMYTAPQKKFKPKAETEILDEIQRCGEELPHTRRVFLADGDAMALSFRRLKSILESIKEHLPMVTRVTAYCLPRNLKKKTVDELAELQSLGLSMVYVGVETGDDELLKLIDKGETYQSTYDALIKLQGAGIKRSVMVINGLGGQALSARHATQTARLINATQPEYLASLVLFFSKGDQRYKEAFSGRFEEMSDVQLFREMQQFIQALELKKTIFRSDHASNLLVLKGVLGTDKSNLLAQLENAISGASSVFLRQSCDRSL